MTLRQALITTLIAATAPAWAQNCITVEVHNVRPQQGHIMVAAYNDAEAFGKKAVLSMRVQAGEAITPVPLCGVAGNIVALTLFQDLDSDGDGPIAQAVLPYMLPLGFHGNFTAV